MAWNTAISYKSKINKYVESEDRMEVVRSRNVCCVMHRLLSNCSKLCKNYYCCNQYSQKKAFQTGVTELSKRTNDRGRRNVEHYLKEASFTLFGDCVVSIRPLLTLLVTKFCIGKWFLRLVLLTDTWLTHF